MAKVGIPADALRRDLIDQKGKDQLVHEPSSIPEVSRSLDRPDSSRSQASALDTNTASESDNAKVLEDKSAHYASQGENVQDRNFLATRRQNDADMPILESVELHSSAHGEPHGKSARELLHHEDGLDNRQRSKNSDSAVVATYGEPKLENIGGMQTDMSKAPLPGSFVLQEPVLQRKDDATSHTQDFTDHNNLGNLHSDRKLPNFPTNDQWKPASGMSGQSYPTMPVRDSDVMVKNVLHGKNPIM